jgi:hypothetical protein
LSVERRGIMRIVALLVTVLTAAVTALAAAAAAWPAAPEQEWITLDDTFVWGDCGFPIRQHDTGRLHFISWYDENGIRQRQIVTAPGARSTFTNVVTGASVSTPNPYAVHKRDNQDGSVTVAFTGLRFRLRGGGVTYVDSGRDLIVFSPTGIVPLGSSGPSDDLCEALRAAIG